MSEKSFRKLIYKATTGIDFSSEDAMYRQLQADGVAMGSPFGPVLANIFAGHCNCEKKLNLEEHPGLLVYCRYDAWMIHSQKPQRKSQAKNLLRCPSKLHESKEFTREEEKDGRLPLMDATVLKNNCGLNSENNNNIRHEKFSSTTTMYRKPTFTGHCLEWKPFTSWRHKISLVRCLAERAKRLRIHNQFHKKLAIINESFQGNGYPAGVVDRMIRQRMSPAGCESKGNVGENVLMCSRLCCEYVIVREEKNVNAIVPVKCLEFW